MKKKIGLLLVLSFLAGSFLYGQNSNGSNASSENSTAKDSKENPFKQPFFEVSDFFFGVSPSVFINTQDGSLSAPSPVFFPVYFGVIWPNNNFFSFQPSLRIWTGYYFINDGHVLPAEIENRTALTFNFMLNIPVVFKAEFWEKSNVKLSGGVAILIRFATIAQGVDEGDFGYYGTAKDDVEKINSWFYENARFLYLSLGADWMFQLTEKIQIGPEFSMYIPVGSVFSTWSLDGLIISLGVKLIY